MNNNNNTDDSNVTRDQWIESFGEGFKSGVSGRSRPPADKRDVPDSHPNSEHDCLEAAQAGYDFAEAKDPYPGQEIDIEKEANAAFDRSDHSAGLSDWV